MPLNLTFTQWSQSVKFFQIVVAFSDNPNNNNYYLFYLTHFRPLGQKLGGQNVGFGRIEDTYIPFRDFMTFNWGFFSYLIKLPLLGPLLWTFELHIQLHISKLKLPSFLLIHMLDQQIRQTFHPFSKQKNKIRRCKKVRKFQNVSFVLSHLSWKVVRARSSCGHFFIHFLVLEKWHDKRFRLKYSDL